MDAATDEGAPLRLGGVSFLNAQPLLHGLLGGLGAERVRLTLAEPAELARKLFEDEVDAALAPVAPLAVHGGLEVVPGIAIGCDGPVRSVVLVADQPLASVAEVWLDSASRTSAVLARLLLRALRNGDEPRYLTRPAGEICGGLPGGVGGLLIGDPALAAEGRFRHVLDLGQAWKELTGLPFVFAAWVARAEVLDPADCALLQASAAVGLAARSDIAAAWARGRGGTAARHLEYLAEHIVYRLDDRALAGLHEFLRRAAEARLLPPCELAFVPQQVAPTSDRALVESPVERAYARLAAGERLSLADAQRLYATVDVRRLARAAHALSLERREASPTTAHVSLLKPSSEPCTREELVEQVGALSAMGVRRVVVEGPLRAGLHLEWFENLFRSLSGVSGVEIHGLCPDQVVALAQQEDLGLANVINRLRASGLSAIVGSGALVLTDRVRRQLCPDGCDARTWIEVMRLAHRAGMPGWVTMEFGAADTGFDRTLHLFKIRELQDETGGVLGFVVIPDPNGPKVDDELYLRTVAVARLILDNVPCLRVPEGALSPALQDQAFGHGADGVYGLAGDANVGRTRSGVRAVGGDGGLRNR